MNFKEYIKEKWYFFIIFSLLIVFSYIIYFLTSTEVSGEIIYVIEGIILFTLIYVFIDFVIINRRITKFKNIINDELQGELEFIYPQDLIYLKEVDLVLNKYKDYKDNSIIEHNDELEFITKWVHDVKVPISAIKILLEDLEDDRTDQLLMQTTYIEENIEKILFHMKSKNFHEDYSIANHSTKNIVSNALKEYAVFFSYKQISLELDVNDLFVRTDEKWSSYIVSQFISNALKHTNLGGVIKIRAYEDVNNVFISITNTSNEKDTMISNDIFKRGYSNNINTKSTGYGLYLSKRLADKMGHSIKVDSVTNSTVTFNLIFFKEENQFLTNMLD